MARAARLASGDTLRVKLRSGLVRLAPGWPATRSSPSRGVRAQASEGWRRGWDSNSNENPRKCLNHNGFSDLTRSLQNRQNRENG